MSSEFIKLEVLLNFVIYGKVKRGDGSCPFVGTRRSQGEEQTRLSASHLPHLIVFSVLARLPLALGLLVGLLSSSPFQGTYRTNISVKDQKKHEGRWELLEVLQQSCSSYMEIFASCDD